MFLRRSRSGLTLLLMLAPSALMAADDRAEAPTNVAAAPEATATTTPAEAPYKPTPEMSVFQQIRSWSDVQLHALYENLIVDPQNLHQFKARPQPRVRDFVSNDYSRIDLRFFYGFAKKLEGEVALGSYFCTPGREGTHAGFGYVDATARYRFTPHFDPTGRAVTGVEAYHPVATSPDGMTDGANRYTAFTSYARDSTRFKNFQEFFNLSYTVITPSEARGVIPDDSPQNDFFTVSVGELRKRGPFIYGVTVAWDHALQGKSANFVTVTPSVNIEVPRNYTLNCPGQWQVGMSWAVKRFGSETEDRFRLRVRWIVKWSQITDAWKHRGGRSPAS